MGRGLHASLSALYGLAEALVARAEQSPEDAHRFDRRVADGISNSLPPEERLFRWFEARHEAVEGGQNAGAPLASAYRLFLVVLFLFGLIVGAVYSAGILAYDGSRPVNVLVSLTAFAFLPLFILVLSLLAALPKRFTRFIPGLSALSESLVQFSPGSALQFVIRRLPQGVRERLSALLAKSAAQRTLFSSVERLLVLYAGQVFGVAFYLAALASAAYLVVTTDLAFAWSTTLDVSDKDLHAVTSRLSAPWAGAAPHAVPTPELIRISRYFRFKDGIRPGAVDPADAEVADLGGWWPFLLMCLLCYGLLPRVLLLALMRGSLRTSIRRSASLLPGASLVLQSMDSQVISTAAEAREVQRSPEKEPPQHSLGVELPLGGCVLIRWAGAGGDEQLLFEQLKRNGLNCTRMIEAGGMLSLEEERAHLSGLATMESSHSVVVAVKGWEPPTADLLDFLKALRESLGKGRPVYVLAFGRSSEPPPVRPLTTNLTVWKRAIDSVGDPWISMVGVELQEAV